MLKFVLIYMGISVILFFIYRLINYWLYYLDEKSKIYWFMVPISFINYLFLLLSFPIVGSMMYITDELYDKFEEQERRKISEDSKMEGKKIGYAYGKAEGYYEGYQEGYQIGYDFANNGKLFSKEYCEEIASFNAQFRRNSPSWCQLPRYHTHWTLDEQYYKDSTE